MHAGVQHRDGYESMRVKSQVVQRSQVKDLQVLQMRPNANSVGNVPAPQLSPASSQQRSAPLPPIGSALQLGQLQQALPQTDPAILSVS